MPDKAALAFYGVTVGILLALTREGNRMPSTFKVAAKFWVGLIAAVLIAVQSAWADAPPWLAPVIAALGAVGVYVTPNADDDDA